MKPFLILTCPLILTSLVASAQDHKAEIKQAASKYIKAYLKNDIPKTVQYMYPKYVDSHGGRDSLIKLIQNDSKKNASQAAKIKSIIISEPGNEVKYGTTIFSVVPDSLTLQLGPLNYYIKSALVAISADDGKNWSFATTTDLKWLISVQPEVANLNIPQTTQPQPVSFNSDHFQKRSTHITKSQFIGTTPIALVVITHDKEYLADTNSIKLVKDKWIGSAMIDPFKIFPTNTAKYGPNSIYGVNRFIIDDKHYPKVYLKFINLMKYIGTADPNIPKSE
jgi:hypothetical protein